MGYVPRCLVPDRPHTLEFIDTQGTARDFPSSDENAQQWITYFDQYEITLEEMAAATFDQDYMDELGAIAQWFRVLSDAERTATLYALVQPITQEQIVFLLRVLQQMAKNSPMSL